MALSTRDHVKPALKQLHWLPVEQQISNKLCLLMHYIHTGQAPQYLSNSSSRNRYRLRSCDMADYILLRTRTKFGEHGFHYSDLYAWNTLPSDLHDTNVFKKRLKTVLFDCAYWLIIVVVRRSWTVRRAAPYKSLIVLYCTTHTSVTLKQCKINNIKQETQLSQTGRASVSRKRWEYTISFTSIWINVLVTCLLFCKSFNVSSLVHVSNDCCTLHYLLTQLSRKHCSMCHTQPNSVSF